MPTYDFRLLSSFDFELLVRDLLREREGIRFEIFTAGRDKGIDLRCLKGKRSRVIVQAKHWADSGYARLLYHMRTKELPKIHRLRPSRYILATSIGLTPRRKDELLELLSPYVRATADILGRDDLNGLLTEFPKVEEANFKLWLTSVPVLQKVLQHEIFVRTDRRTDQLGRTAQLYVQNRSFLEAKKRLEDGRLCVIAGPPGIGKSMLADMLLIDYIARDYEPVIISADVSDGDRLFALDRRQIFLYDDFLGRTNLAEHLNKNEDSRLVEFMEEIHRTAGKRFVLTTREYIL